MSAAGLDSTAMTVLIVTGAIVAIGCLAICTSLVYRRRAMRRYNEGSSSSTRTEGSKSASSSAKKSAKKKAEVERPVQGGQVDLEVGAGIARVLPSV